MAKAVIWSDLALRDLQQILEYWNTRNRSTEYSTKLKGRVFECIESIREFPKSGRMTNHEGIRMKLLGDYYIVYEEEELEVIIHAIWDTRQDPLTLERRINK